MSQRHILFFASWYPSRDRPALGNFVRQHARAAAMKNTVSVVYACSDEQLQEGEQRIEENHEGNLHEYIVYYGKVRSATPVIAQLKKRKAYRTSIRAGMDAATRAHGKPALVHLHVIWPAAVAVNAIVDELNVPLLITEHWSGYLPEDGNYRGRLLKHFSRSISRKARRITVVSGRMEEAMRAHGLGTQFSRLPNVVDTELFRPAAAARNDGKVRLLHVSMLVDREKNISGMLHVMKKLENHAELQMEIVGDGPERASHEALAKQLGVRGRNVFFTGYKDAAGVAEAMQHADALLMFSHFEGMPVTIIEAQSCGLPVIATKTGAIPEMVGEHEGLLVPPGDEAALEKAIVQFMQHRDRYSAAAIREKSVQQYSMPAVSDALDRLYTSMLQS